MPQIFLQNQQMKIEIRFKTTVEKLFQSSIQKEIQSEIPSNKIDPKQTQLLATISRNQEVSQSKEQESLMTLYQRKVLKLDQLLK